MPKNKSKAAVEELDDDDLELMDDDEAEATPVKAKKSKDKAASPKTKVAEKPAKADNDSSGMGAGWLAEHINEELGTSITAANVRVILRRMASDGDLEREVGSDRSRYTFTGEKDPTVRAVLKRVRSGEVTRNKAEAIEAATEPRKSRKAKAAAEVVEELADEKPKPKRKAKAEPVVEETPPKKPARRRRTED